MRFPFQPGLLCLKAFDPAECMHRIRDNTADVAMLDSADVYMAGRYFGLVPIAAGRDHRVQPDVWPQDK